MPSGQQPASTGSSSESTGHPSLSTRCAGPRARPRWPVRSWTPWSPGVTRPATVATRGWSPTPGTRNSPRGRW